MCIRDRHYADANDRNRVIYHNQKVSQDERLQEVIDDAIAFLPICKDEYEHTEDYQLLLRAIQEQTKQDGTGKRKPKTKEDNMDSSVLQNPSDPDATYRKKAGKQYRGYSANITETVDENCLLYTSRSAWNIW